MGKYVDLAQRFLDDPHRLGHQQSDSDLSSSKQVRKKQVVRSATKSASIPSGPGTLTSKPEFREPSTTLTTETTKGSRPACFACNARRTWRSIHGVTVCGLCHPPASPKLVAEWIDPEDGNA